MKLRDLQSRLISHVILWICSFCWKERIHGRWFPYKSRCWNRLSISFFTSSDKFPCTFSHWVFTCHKVYLSRQVSLHYFARRFHMYHFDCKSEEFLDKVSGMITVRGLPKTFPCVPGRRHWSRLDVARGLGTTAAS